MTDDWNLEAEVGGLAALESIVRALYDRMFGDILIGFFFDASDKEQLIRSQCAYLQAHLGDRSGHYEGPSIRRAHAQLAILPGHFDRRHQILREVLETHTVPAHVQDAWLGLDRSLREFVVREGKKAIDERYP
ncbi:MAG: group 1 truncated hemoglobin [bacterium]